MDVAELILAIESDGDYAADMRRVLHEERMTVMSARQQVTHANERVRAARGKVGKNAKHLRRAVWEDCLPSCALCSLNSTQAAAKEAELHSSAVAYEARRVYDMWIDRA